MYKPRYILCADTILHDVTTNAASAIQIIDDATPIAFPFAFLRLSTLVCIDREPNDSERPPAVTRITFQEKTVFEGPASIDFQGRLRTRVILIYNGLVVIGPGTIRISIDLDGQRDWASTTIDVNSPPAIQARTQ